MTNKYEFGKIYKLVNSVDDMIYIGSTCRSLEERLNKHINTSNIKNYLIYTHLNKIGWDKVTIILLENIKCDNKKQLLEKERYWCDKLNPQLNLRKAIILHDEKQNYNNERYKKWYIKNNIKINCSCGKFYIKNKKSIHINTLFHIHNSTS